MPCLPCGYYLVRVLCLPYGRYLAHVPCLYYRRCLAYVPRLLYCCYMAFVPHLHYGCCLIRMPYLFCQYCLPRLLCLFYGYYLPCLPCRFDTSIFFTSSSSIELPKSNGWSIKKYLDYYNIFIGFSRYSVCFATLFLFKNYSFCYLIYKQVKYDI